MRLTGKLVARFKRGVLPARSVRLRLTALYGGLFLICGVGLLTITYLLVRHTTRGLARVSPAALLRRPGASSRRSFTTDHAHLLRGVHAALGYQNAVDLHQLLVESAIALAGMAVISVVLGWVVAGRVLSPLRTITARTRRISEQSLHQRLALRGPRDELTELADTIDELLARLEAAFEAQRRFVANASHELRTPLAMMRTRLDVAVGKREGVPPQTRALEAGLRKDLDRADGLLEAFLVLARAQHGTLTDHTIVSLGQIVAEALTRRRDQIVDQQLEVRTVLGPVGVPGSETLLARMVENVIENAVLHNQPHGFINIACEPAGGAARLVIESDGPILDEDAVARLAQPFQRLGAERTGSRKGQGLGLSIVAAVAGAHGGALELQPRSQGGLRVQIILPAAVPASASPVPV